MDGARLGEIRKEHRMTQKDLAIKLSVSKNTISSYERNLTEPDDQMKVEIARLFNVSLDYLLGVSEIQTPLKSSPQLIYMRGLPAHAQQELEEFLGYLARKYHL